MWENVCMCVCLCVTCMGELWLLFITCDMQLEDNAPPLAVSLLVNPLREQKKHTSKSFNALGGGGSLARKCSSPRTLVK